MNIKDLTKKVSNFVAANYRIYAGKTDTNLDYYIDMAEYTAYCRSGNVSVITNEDPTNSLKFDYNYWPDESRFIDLSSADVTFNLNTGVTNVVGNVNIFEVLADGVHAIYLGTGAKFNGHIPSDIDGKILDAGVYIFYAIYSTDGFVLNVPENQVKSPTLGTVSTQPATSITDTTAVGNGNILSLGNVGIAAHGMVWSTSQNPTLADSSSDEGAATATGAFTSNITSLSAGVIYYVRAYITDIYGSTVYGDQIGFTAGTSIILMSDNFADSSIDHTKWNEPSHPTGVTLVEASSALKLDIGATAAPATSVVGVYTNSFPDDVLVFNAIIDWNVNPVGAISCSFYVSDIVGTGIEDGGLIFRGVPASSQEYAYLITRKNSSNLDTLLTSVLRGSRFKIKHTRSTGLIVFSYRNGSAWVDLLTSSESIDLDINRFLLLKIGNSTTEIGYITIADFYLTKEDYATETP